eukprot:403358704
MRSNRVKAEHPNDIRSQQQQFQLSQQMLTQMQLGYDLSQLSMQQSQQPKTITKASSNSKMMVMSRGNSASNLNNLNQSKQRSNLNRFMSNSNLFQGQNLNQGAVNHSQSSNHIKFKTSYQKSRKNEVSNSLRNPGKDQLAATMHQLSTNQKNFQQQSQNLLTSDSLSGFGLGITAASTSNLLMNINNQQSQPILHGSKAFLKTTIENMKRTNQLVQQQQFQLQQQKQLIEQQQKQLQMQSSQLQFQQQISSQIEKQHSQELEEQYQLISINTNSNMNNGQRQQQFNKQKSSHGSIQGLNNDQSLKQFMLYTNDNINLQNLRSFDNVKKDSITGQQLSSFQNHSISKSNNQIQQNISSQGGRAVDQENIQQEQKPLTRTQSKITFDSMQKGGNQRMQQIYSMKKLESQENNEYFQKHEKDEIQRQLAREQSQGSLSRQKSQAKFQTFTQLGANYNQNSMGKEQQREPSQSSILQLSNQMSKQYNKQKNPVLAMVNCYSMANLGSNLNIQNIKHHMQNNSKDCVSPVRKALDHSDQNADQNGDIQQTKKKMFQRTGPVKILRRDDFQNSQEDNIAEQQSSQPAMYSQQKESSRGILKEQFYHQSNMQQRQDDQDSSSQFQSQKTLSKKQALHKIVNFDKVRDLIRQSSRERRQDLAQQVKDNKGEAMLARTTSIKNFNQKQLQEYFEGPDCRLTPIMMSKEEHGSFQINDSGKIQQFNDEYEMQKLQQDTVDETLDEIKDILKNLEEGMRAANQ